LRKQAQAKLTAKVEMFAVPNADKDLAEIQKARQRYKPMLTVEQSGVRLDRQRNPSKYQLSAEDERPHDISEEIDLSYLSLARKRKKPKTIPLPETSRRSKYISDILRTLLIDFNLFR
jgi:hypothetical protein